MSNKKETILPTKFSKFEHNHKSDSFVLILLTSAMLGSFFGAISIGLILLLIKEVPKVNENLLIISHMIIFSIVIYLFIEFIRYFQYKDDIKETLSDKKECLGRGMLVITNNYRIFNYKMYSLGVSSEIKLPYKYIHKLYVSLMNDPKYIKLCLEYYEITNKNFSEDDVKELKEVILENIKKVTKKHIIQLFEDFDYDNYQITSYQGDILSKEVLISAMSCENWLEELIKLSQLSSTREEQTLQRKKSIIDRVNNIASE